MRNFSWSVFSRIWTEYGKIRITKNSVFGHFSHSDGKVSKDLTISLIPFCKSKNLLKLHVFFPAVHISFHHQSHLVYLEN